MVINFDIEQEFGATFKYPPHSGLNTKQPINSLFSRTYEETFGPSHVNL